MKSSELEYELPPELIAQRPLERRDESRLLVFDRGTGAVRHRRFDELPEELPPETLTVVNDTRVLPARLRLERPGGGEAEVLLLERLGQNGLWEGLVRPSRKLRAGQRLGPVELLEPLGESRPVGALRRPGHRVQARRRSADELPSAALDAARAGDGVRGRGGDAPPLPARDRGAVPLLQLRRRDARAVNVEPVGAEELDAVVEVLSEAAAWLRSRGIEQWPSPFPADWVAPSIERGETYLVRENGAVAGT